MLSFHRDQPLAYRPDIDGMRALAVVAVIANHFDRALLPSGYLGVDIFFVISGYVITGALASRLNGSLRPFLIDFYRRRFKRIVPALGLFILIAALFVAIFDPTPRTTLKTGLYALFGLSNLYLYSNATDYFSESAELNAFTHTWSLGVEEQFYVIFPLLLWLFSRTRRGAAPVLIALSVLSLIAFLMLSRDAPAFAYFSPVTRFWELAMGAVAFACAPWARAPRFGALANATLIALILALFLPLQWASIATLIVVSLTAATIVFLQNASASQTLLATPPLIFLGRISYSLYLWHWFVLWLSRLTIGIEWWTAPFQIALMLALATASYRFVENPLRHRQWAASPRTGLIIGATALAAIALFIAALDGPLRGRFYLGHLTGQSLPSHLQRTWWTDKATGENREPCHVHGYNKQMVETCLGKAPVNAKAIFLIGDSHARNYLPAIRAVFPRDTIRYLTIGHDCAYLPAPMAAELKKYGCPDYVRDVEQTILAQIKPGDSVVVGQRLFEREARRTGPLYMAHLQALAQTLAQKNAFLIVLDGTFPPAYPPERCLNVPWRRAELNGCTTPTDHVQMAFAPFDKAAMALAQQNRNVFYAPLRMGLCGPTQCGQTLADGTPIWHDRGHITEQAASALAPLLRQALQEQHFPF